MNSPLLVICGPTGVGKSGLALELAQKYKTELISADSRQVYKDFDIAMGKEVELLPVGRAEKGPGFWKIDDIKVHLYDCCSPKKRFTASLFKSKAEQIIELLHKHKKVPIIVGGTGLYIAGLLYDFSYVKTDSSVVAHLTSHSTQELLEMLQEVDPATASFIDVSNRVRILRALEVYLSTGKSFHELQTRNQPRFDVLYIGLTMDRHLLYQKVDRQVEEWFQLGLVEEVTSLLKKYSPEEVSIFSGIHYKQVLRYLDHDISYEEMVQLIKFERHSYIRRQYTWFNKQQQLQWFDVQKDKKKLGEVLDAFMTKTTVV